MGSYYRGGTKVPYPLAGIPYFPKYSEKYCTVYHKLHPLFTTIGRYTFQFQEWGGAPIIEWPSPIYGAAIHYTDGQPELVVVLQGGMIPASSDPYWMTIYGFKLSRINVGTTQERYLVDYDSERLILHDSIKFDECRLIFDPTGTFFSAEGYGPLGDTHALITVHLVDGISAVPSPKMVDQPEWSAAIQAGELAEWVSHKGRGMLCSDSVTVFDFEHPFDWSIYHEQIKFQYNGVEVLANYPMGADQYPPGYVAALEPWYTVGPPFPFVFQDNVAEIGEVTAYSVPLALFNVWQYRESFAPSIFGFHRLGGVLNPALELFGVDAPNYILGKLSRV